MPRRRQRFSDLEKQFKESGGVAAPGSRLAGYIAFKKGENKIEVKKKLTAAERKRYGFAILPFGVTPEASTPKRYAASITAYSNASRAGLGVTNNMLGYEDIDASTEQAGNFYPALIKVFIKSGTINDNQISGVTQKKYRRIEGATYTYPFGRTTTDVTDAVTGATESTVNEVDAQDVRNTLVTFLAGLPAEKKVGSISYEPEVFRTGSKALASPA
ncbi:MAG: hypothetical protein KME54_29415 [Tolypothrix brevis GSE-NOS-MK-07-07A]|jgi:hypothetical protein|nr:hypothetical protein [Tolypothrix brevis GSE-NOS-MK-07-07A]